MKNLFLVSATILLSSYGIAQEATGKPSTYFSLSVGKGTSTFVNLPESIYTKYLPDFYQEFEEKDGFVNQNQSVLYEDLYLQAQFQRELIVPKFKAKKMQLTIGGTFGLAPKVYGGKWLNKYSTEAYDTLFPTDGGQTEYVNKVTNEDKVCSYEASNINLGINTSLRFNTKKRFSYSFGVQLSYSVSVNNTITYSKKRSIYLENIYDEYNPREFESVDNLIRAKSKGPVIQIMYFQIPLEIALRISKKDETVLGKASIFGQVIPNTNLTFFDKKVKTNYGYWAGLGLRYKLK